MIRVWGGGSRTSKLRVYCLGLRVSVIILKPSKTLSPKLYGCDPGRRRRTSCRDFGEIQDSATGLYPCMGFGFWGGGGVLGIGSKGFGFRGLGFRISGSRGFRGLETSCQMTRGFRV